MRSILLCALPFVLPACGALQAVGEGVGSVVERFATGVSTGTVGEIANEAAKAVAAGRSDDVWAAVTAGGTAALLLLGKLGGVLFSKMKKPA